MSIDADELFRRVDKAYAEGGVPTDLLEKTDYVNQAKEVLLRLKEALGYEDLTDEEFFEIYKERAGIG